MISTVKKLYDQGREFVKKNQLERADECFDMCIAQLAECTLNNIEHVEGAPVDLWKTRTWVAIEKAGLLPD
tara:strand:- start:521 stop:733 length:213 start_codon:yes stop_codon:yes gene_type:complete